MVKVLMSRLPAQRMENLLNNTAWPFMLAADESTRTAKLCSQLDGDISWLEAPSTLSP